MEIDNIVKIVQDIGLTTVLMIIVIYFAFKYGPKYIELKLKRMEEKNYMLDSMKAVIENNTHVVSNNSEVMKLNSTTIKNYTDNSHKLENKIDDLTKVVQEANTNIKVLKERSK